MVWDVAEEREEEEEERDPDGEDCGKEEAPMVSAAATAGEDGGCGRRVLAGTEAPAAGRVDVGSSGRCKRNG